MSIGSSTPNVVCYRGRPLPPGSTATSLAGRISGVECEAATEDPWEGKVDPESEEPASLGSPCGFFLAAVFVSYSVNKERPELIKGGDAGEPRRPAGSPSMVA